jgi:hypothetical protein
MPDKNTLVLQSQTDALRIENGLCSEPSVRSSDDSKEFIGIKIEEEEIHIKVEVDPFAISCSATKDEPEVSPQTFHRYQRLPSVIMPFLSVPFHLNQLPVVSGNGLYLFTECVKFKG